MIFEAETVSIDALKIARPPQCCCPLLLQFFNSNKYTHCARIKDSFTILVSLKERIVKPFSLKYLAEKEET
jgi:hypothetical protein